MNYQRFEDLPVWQEAIRLAEAVYDLTEAIGSKASYSLRDQIERAAVSVSNNIAEGFERGTTNELLAFLYIARGSAGETRSMLCFMERRRKLAAFKEQIVAIKPLAESCSRQLYSWAQSLQDSETSVGQRRMTRAVRQQRDQAKSARAFQEKVLQMLPKDHPMRQFHERKAQVDEK